MSGSSAPTPTPSRCRTGTRRLPGGRRGRGSLWGWWSCSGSGSRIPCSPRMSVPVCAVRDTRGASVRDRGMDLCSPDLDLPVPVCPVRGRERLASEERWLGKRRSGQRIWSASAGLNAPGWPQAELALDGAVLSGASRGGERSGGISSRVELRAAGSGVWAQFIGRLLDGVHPMGRWVNLGMSEITSAAGRNNLSGRRDCCGS